MALLERPASRSSLRQSVPRRLLAVRAAKSPSHLAGLLARHPVDSLVVGPEALRGPLLEAVRRDYASLPVILYGPVRSDDARTLASVERRHLAAVLVEGVDEPVLASALLRAGMTARRSAMLLPLAAELGLAEPLQLETWRLLVERAETAPGTAGLAGELAVRRETLSRRFGARGAVPLKPAIDLVRLVAAAQRLGCAALRVEEVAAMLRFSSTSLLQRTSRRILGHPAAWLRTVPPEQVVGVVAGRLKGGWE